MSGRSGQPHNRSEVDLAASLLAMTMRLGSRSFHRRSRSNTRSNARRHSREQNRCNGDRRVGWKRS